MSSQMKPYSWALVARMAQGQRIVKYEGMWMHEERAKVLDFLRRQVFRIMDLPPELRHQILRYLPANTTVTVYLAGRNGLPPSGVELPVTTRAGDKLLRQETLMLTIEQTTFSIHSFVGNTSFQNWLQHVDLRLASDGYTNGFDAVKSLSFPFFSRFPHAIFPATQANSDIELMLKCRNLESVSMEWHFSELASYDAATRHTSPKTVQQLCAQYRLDRMLGLRKLKKLVLVQFRGVGSIALQHLAAWSRANMAEVGGHACQVTVQ
ncbi:hypothetical protein LTR36_008831 [Oleoguttula mirabilis]|uniref:Uncharacterized protein n=1 Tax=Oleoguttula mirabilis TaxID=1507867 RepID=A0AAV9J865_9PEZI|nr:hypothetical protein LTR36_008831 [Oleoguttula mirabilis]